MTNKTGFTLIELLVVVAIIAILVTIAVPSYQAYITKSKVKEAQSNLVALSLSAEQAYQRTLSYPTLTLNNTAAISNNSAFKTWHPSSNAFSYQYTSTDGVTYTLKAEGVDQGVIGCTLTLNQQGSRTISGCKYNDTWVN